MNKFSFSGLNDESSVISVIIGGIELKTNVSDDFIIPEINSDVKKVLLHTATSNEAERSVDGSSVTISGNICHNILMLCENGSIEGITYNQKYEAKDVVAAGEDIFLSFGDVCVDAQCNIVNPRKLNLSTSLSCPAKLLQRKNTSVKIEGTESIDDEITVQRKAGMITTAEIVSKYASGITVSRDIELDGNYPQMSQIIFSDVSLKPYEIKTKDDSMIVRTKAKAQIVYRSEEGNIFANENTFIIEETLEFPSASAYEWFASAECKDLSCEVSSNNYGEMRIAELDFLYDITLSGIRNVTVNTVNDVYSTEYCCDQKRESATLFNHKRTSCSSLSVNASAEREAIGAVNARSVLLGDVKIGNVTCDYSKEKKKLIVSAVAEISTVCENNLFDDGDEKYVRCVFSTSFKCEHEAADSMSALIYTPTVTANDVRFRLDSNKLYCDFEASVKITATGTDNVSYVKTVCIDKNSPINTSPVPMTLCYPSGKETLWDIAKYYNVTRESIMFTNDLDNEDINNKKVLLISSFKSKGQTLTKVI